MKKIKCEILIHNNKSLHLNQIIAGFIELEKQNQIILSKKILNDSNLSFIEVIINNKITAIYETQDSGSIFACDFDNKNIDFYFKRSFNSEMRKSISNKIYPLGLNYDVNSKYGNYHDLKYKTRNFIKKILKKGKNEFYIEDFECNQKKDINNKICFLTRFWNPYDDEVEDKNVRNERIQINNFRAECINKCRSIYKDDFLGGAYKDQYAINNYKNCIVNDSKITQRDKYLEILKDYDICIATKGLHNSIGWKFAEYVALGKVIITEPLDYEIPGNFKKNENYLEFENINELIEKIELVRNDKSLARKIISNNINYYNNFLRPDKLILNTLNLILNNN